MTARFAVYLAPPPDTALWRFGSRVIGYDAVTGCDVATVSLPGVAMADWNAMTVAPRAYGFHATLKAPFRLVEGMTLEDLRNALGAFCRERQAFDLGPLCVSVMPSADGGFVALTQQRRSIELEGLEAAAVEIFDHFRSPPTDAEMARRNVESLSDRQKGYLSAWGYPFVMEDYRFHMTLTGSLAEPAWIADQLADAYAAAGSQHMIVDALVLFAQSAPGEAFRIVERHPFGLDRASAPVAAVT